MCPEMGGILLLSYVENQYGMGATVAMVAIIKSSLKQIPRLNSELLTFSCRSIIIRYTNNAGCRWLAILSAF